MRYIARLRVPACWRELVKVEFPTDRCALCRGTPQVHAIDDPGAYTDDYRYVHGTFVPQNSFVGRNVYVALVLSSGQGNYYGEVYLCTDGVRFSYADKVALDVVVEDFEHLVFDRDGDTYSIEIDWVEKFDV